MLRRMPPPDDCLPAMRADYDFLPIRHSMEAVRQGIHHVAEVPEPGLVAFEIGGAPACGTVESQSVRRGLAPRVGHQHPTGDILEASHPEGTVESASQPPCHPDMIRMHVGADDPFD